MKNIHLVSLVAIFLFSVPSVMAATEFPVQARFFAGNSNGTPTQLNAELNSQGFKAIDSNFFYGLEANYSLGHFLKMGLRYERRVMSLDQLSSTPTLNYSASLNQDAVSGVVRLPLIHSKFLIFDVFGGVGGANTAFRIKNGSQDGELSKKGPDGWFGSTVTVYGGSVGFGYKGFYVNGELGLENNRVANFKRTGTINNNIQTVDLSGTYVLFSVVFDGVTATQK